MANFVTLAEFSLIDKILPGHISTEFVIHPLPGSTTEQESIVFSYGHFVLDVHLIREFIFAGGMPVSVRWDEIRAELGLPERFTFETAIVLAALRIEWIHYDDARAEMVLMAAWASVLANPQEALGLSTKRRPDHTRLADIDSLSNRARRCAQNAVVQFATPKGNVADYDRCDQVTLGELRSVPRRVLERQRDLGVGSMVLLDAVL